MKVAVEFRGAVFLRDRVELVRWHVIVGPAVAGGLIKYAS